MSDIRYRTATLEIETRGKNDGIVTATLSTENSVDMPYGKEILSHEPGAVNLSRAKNGLPLLWQHNPNEIIGRVENIRLENRKLKGDLRPGNSQKAKELWQDVRAGIIKDVSIGYSIDEKPIRDGEIFIVPKWTVYETSLVSIGADAAAGIGRGIKNNQKFGGITMIENHEHEEQPLDSWKRDKYQERERVQEILALRKRFSSAVSEDDAQRAIANGVSLESFRREIVERMAAKTPMIDPIGNSWIGMSEREASQFSFTRALRAMMLSDWSQAGFESEASRAVEQKLGRKAQGVFVPGEVLSFQTRGLVKSTPSAGGDLVATELLAANFIEMLRAKTQIINLGATVIGGLTGDVAIPKQTGGATAYWVAEGQDITLSQPSFGQVTLSPKTVAARTQFSRKLLLQATPDIEQIVRNDLSNVLAVELDRAAVNGSGSNNEPTGVLNTAGIGVVAIGTNGGAPTWDHIVSLIGSVEQNNVLGTGFLTNSKVKASLSKTFLNSTYGEIPIWQFAQDGEGRLAGYRALTSANVPSNLTKGTGTNLSAIIFGNWSDLLIGQWGVLDLLLDPYTLAASGGMQVVAMLDVDIAVRHPESFAVIKDAIA